LPKPLDINLLLNETWFAPLEDTPPPAKYSVEQAIAATAIVGASNIQSGSGITSNVATSSTAVSVVGLLSVVPSEEVRSAVVILEGSQKTQEKQDGGDRLVKALHFSYYGSSSLHTRSGNLSCR
jgi:hypothetical protein